MLMASLTWTLYHHSQATLPSWGVLPPVRAVANTGWPTAMPRASASKKTSLHSRPTIQDWLVLRTPQGWVVS